MVVGEGEGDAVVSQRQRQGLPEGEVAAGGAPLGEGEDVAHAVAAIENEQQYFLGAGAADAGHREPGDVLRGPDRGVVAGRDSVGEGERSDEACRLGGADAGVAGEFVDPRPGEAGHPTELGEKFTSRSEDMLPPPSGPEMDRHQLCVRECTDSQGEKSLSGEIGRWWGQHVVNVKVLRHVAGRVIHRMFYPFSWGRDMIDDMSRSTKDGSADPLTFKKPRVRRFGVLLEGELAFRPLLNIGPSGDGGLLLIPRTAPEGGWLAARATPAPAFGRPDFDPVVMDSVHLPKESRPKLHFHRSGGVTLKAQQGSHRNVRVQLPSLEEINGRQVFFFHQNDPMALPATEIREEDSFVVSHDGPPASLSVAGVVFHFRQAEYVREEFLGGRPWGLVRGDAAYLTMDMRAFGMDSFLVLLPRLSYDSTWPAKDAQLMGLCGDFHHKSPYVYLVDESSRAAPTPWVLQSHELPVFPSVPIWRTRDRRRVQRGDGESVKYGPIV